MSTAGLYTQLQSSAEGLSGAEALNRQEGQKQLSAGLATLYQHAHILLRQFSSPLTILLIVAVILSYLLGEYQDSVIILVILLASGSLGFWQETKAGNAAAALRRMVQMKNTVLRDGTPVEIEAEKIVPGDIILFDAGDMVPADCRIIMSDELHVNESALTGEAFPVEKNTGVVEQDNPVDNRKNCLWKGTNVVSGIARAMVVYTGKNTLLGQVTETLGQTPATAFERGVKRYGLFLLKVSVILSVLILIINLVFQRPLLESVLFSLALAIGMAPELLPAIISLSMSAGAKNLMKKKVIVKRLASVFNLGEVNLLCTDKTGTVTEGVMKVKGFFDPQGERSAFAELCASVNAALQNGYTNPVDQAIISLQPNINGYSRVDEIPYDFNRKRISVAALHESECYLITKGAFKEVLNICDRIRINESLTVPVAENEKLQEEICKRFSDWSGEGYRVLAVAYKKLQEQVISPRDEKEMIFAGYILIEDPLKEDVPESIEQLRKLEMECRIITGDNRYSAFHIAKQLGLSDPVVVTGDELDSLKDEIQQPLFRHVDVYAETGPLQKEQIVRSYQQSGYHVAYIGDGINDVAAINAADVGISANNAVDVARDAADFILLEKNLSVLADGVYEGRKCFSNSMKYIFITTGATFGNMLSLSIISVILPFLPMLPKQILLTNLITDIPFLTIASDEVDAGSVMKPGKWDMKLVRRFMIIFGLHSSVFDLITFFIFQYGFRVSAESFRTSWFLESVATEIILLFIIRTRKSFIKSRPGKLLFTGTMIALAICLAFVYIPFTSRLMGFVIPAPEYLLTIVLILIVYTITGDLLKLAFYHQRPGITEEK